MHRDQKVKCSAYSPKQVGGLALGRTGEASLVSASAEARVFCLGCFAPTEDDSNYGCVVLLILTKSRFKSVTCPMTHVQEKDPLQAQGDKNPVGRVASLLLRSTSSTRRNLAGSKTEPALRLMRKRKTLRRLWVTRIQ